MTLRSVCRLNWARLSHSYATRPPLAIPYKTGQPMHETRPHYLPEPGFLTPGITALEYYDRRMRLAKDLPIRSAVIVAGNNVVHSSGSVFYHFQQDTDLYYLTGWLEPDSVAVIEKVADNKNDDDVVFHMLVPPKTQPQSSGKVPEQDLKVPTITSTQTRLLKSTALMPTSRAS